MTLKVAILDDYQAMALASADWSVLDGRAEITVFDHHLGHDVERIAEVLEPFEVLVLMRERTPLPRTLLERLPRLRLVVTTGMRNGAIDMEAAAERGVLVCGTGMLGAPAFEHAWALILALLKRIPWEDATMKAGGWQHAPSELLEGKVLSLYGLGRLGALTARVGLAFGMEVIAWSRNLTDERAAAVGVQRVEREALFRRADVLSIHVVLSERTRGTVGARELAWMKPGAWLVNTSRGPIVDEGALLDALTERRIAGAGLDVFDVEPLPVDHPLRRLDNVVLTGHTGYVVREMFPVAYGQALEDIVAWLDGEPVRVIGGAAGAPGRAP